MAKYTLDIGREFEQQIDEVAKTKGLSKAEVIRRAVATYVVLNRETQNGGRIVVKNDKSPMDKELISI